VDAHVAMCSLKDLLRRFCKMPKSLCLKLIQLNRKLDEEEEVDGATVTIQGQSDAEVTEEEEEEEEKDKELRTLERHRFAFRSLMSEYLPGSRRELLCTLLTFLRDVHLVQTGKESIASVLFRRRLQTPSSTALPPQQPDANQKVTVVNNLNKIVD